MPKVTAPLFSLAASKTFGNVLTFQKRASGHVVYLKNVPGSISPFTPSGAQNAVRAEIKLRVEAWQALSASFKSQWDVEAKLIGYFGTGYHLYIHNPTAFVPGYTWSDPAVAWADSVISWAGS